MPNIKSYTFMQTAGTKVMALYSNMETVNFYGWEGGMDAMLFTDYFVK